MAEANYSNPLGVGTVNAAPLVPMASKSCAGQNLLVLTLPEKGSKRRRRWVFCRQLESIIFGTAQHSSNLLFDIQELSLDASVRHLEKKTLRANHMSQAE